MTGTLVRTDKNGTKYYTSNVCPKCGGRGYLPEYGYVDSGVCFKCGGTGYYTTTWKEYTKEYAAKLEAKRVAREMKKTPEINAKFLEKMGMNENGECFVVVGNTYAIKDELKELGAKFNYTLLWHFDREVEGYKTVKVTADDIFDKNMYGQFMETENTLNTVKKMLDNAIEKKGEYIGNVGDKVTLTLTYKGYHTFETYYTYYGELNYIYTFEDENGNTFVWVTSASKDFEENKTYTVKATIKAHKEYKGVKQTNLTRCRVA